MYSGVTTNYLAGLVVRLIENYPRLHGLYHVASQPISKYDLLCLIRQVFELDIDIQPVAGEVSDRTLQADRFLAVTGFDCPGWPDSDRRTLHRFHALRGVEDGNTCSNSPSRLKARKYW